MGELLDCAGEVIERVHIFSSVGDDCETIAREVRSLMSRENISVSPGSSASGYDDCRYTHDYAIFDCKLRNEVPILEGRSRESVQEEYYRCIWLACLTIENFDTIRGDGASRCDWG